ncbi:riboflavin synthase [Sporosarcina siberiensis]|uniref:Riboflavin synthase n=1 Tax=Sporosarcina siberiensis TaxID=1365606 RepID=A0ABW4SBG6_9BACL
MFTGIVEEIGTVTTIQQGSNSLRILLRCDKVLENVEKGDSIAVNGVCLTVSDYSRNHFTVDVMPETVKATTMQSLRTGSRVNLERAMRANGRFGGHFVSGHVDCIGEIVSVGKKENAIYMEIGIASNFLKYFIMKGSVTVDGTSLTVFGVTDKSFTISLIPVTQDDSIIGRKRIGDQVNVECDMLAKYIERLMEPDKGSSSGSLSMDKLVESGFLD